MTLNNKTYDFLKMMVTKLLPAVATAYYALSKFIAVPYPEEVVGVIAIIEAFIGTMIGISSSNYTGDGTLTMNGDTAEVVVEQDKLQNGKMISLVVMGDGSAYE